MKYCAKSCESGHGQHLPRSPTWAGKRRPPNPRLRWSWVPSSIAGVLTFGRSATISRTSAACPVGVTELGGGGGGGGSASKCEDKTRSAAPKARAACADHAHRIHRDVGVWIPSRSVAGHSVRGDDRGQRCTLIALPPHPTAPSLPGKDWELVDGLPFWGMRCRLSRRSTS